MDQFFATSTLPHWQQWSHMKMTYRLSGASLFLMGLLAHRNVRQLRHRTVLLSHR
jgi:hypothetical protein